MATKLELLEELQRRGKSTPAQDQELADLQSAPEGRSFGQLAYENIIGSGEVDTPGEWLGELIRGGGAATARGMVDMPAIPANLLQLGAAGYDKLTDAEGPGALSQALNRLPDTRQMLEQVPVIGPESAYVAPGKAGEYIRNIFEFAGGGGIMAASRKIAAMLQAGAAGGVSEFAGQTAAEMYPENPNMEMIARIVAAGLTPSAITKKPVPELRAQHIKVLEDAGVDLFAGQKAAASKTLRAIEGTLEPTMEQLGQLTAAAMRTIGSNFKIASPEAIGEAYTRLGASFDRVTDALIVDPTLTPIVSNLKAVADRYNRTKSAGESVKTIDGLVQYFDDALNGNKAISKAELVQWRSDLSAMTVSGNPATTRAARDALDAVEDLIHANLRASGNANLVEEFAKTRMQYKNLLAVEKAVNGAGTLAANGLVTPASLRAGIGTGSKSKGYVLGTGGDLAELTRAAQGVLTPLPTVMAGGGRVIEGAGRAAAGIVGHEIGGVPGAIAGVVLPEVAQTIAQSRPMQIYGSGKGIPLSALTPQQRALLAVPRLNEQIEGRPR